MPALPPVDLDSWRRWAADRWRRTTDQAIGAVGAHGWDLDAGRRIEALGTPLAPLAAPPLLEPAPEPEPIYGPPGPPPDWAPPSQPPPLAAAPAAQWMPFEPARQQAAAGAGAWWQDATQRIEGLGTELAAIPSGLGQGFQSAVGADQGLGQTMTDIGAGVQGPAPTVGQVQFPGRPTEFTFPETGTPEGEAITTQLAETAARETPGGGLAGEALRRLGGAYRSPLLRADALRGYSFERAANPEDPVTQGLGDVAFGMSAGLAGPGGEAGAALAPLRRAEQLGLEGLEGLGAESRVTNLVPDSAKPPGFGDWARSLAYGVRLSNPAGILADAMSGPVEVTWKLARDALTQRPSATVAEAAGIKAGMARALPTWWQTLRQALPEAADVPGGSVLERLQAGGVATGQSEVGRSLVERLRAAEVPDAGGTMRAATAIEFPSRLRRAGDQANWNTAFQQDLHRQAARWATQQGQRPLSREWWDAVQGFVDDAPDVARDTASAQADLVTFRNDPGTTGRALSGLANDPVLSTLFPFVRTGYNVGMRGLERTPGAGLVGIGADIARGSGSLRDRIGAVPRLQGRLADQALGSTLFGTAALLAEQGLVTGEGPDNPTQLAELRAHGWRPNSLWLPEPGTPGGGAYYSYEKVGPLAFPLALAGAYGDAVRFREAGEGRTEALDEAAANFGRWGRDQSVLRQAADIYEAVGDPIEGGARLAASTVGPYLGIGGAAAAVGSAVDPYQRDPGAAAEGGYPGGRVGAEAAARLPGLRQTLPARRDPFGRPVPNEGFGAGLVLPYRRAQTPEQRGEREAPYRYVGSKSVEEDTRIAAALRHVDDFTAGRTKVRPRAEERRLASRFAGRENPRYEATRRQARQAATASSAS